MVWNIIFVWYFFIKGDTRAIFASLGKTAFYMLLFTVFDIGAANTPAADWTSFRGIFSKHETFLALTSLGIFKTSSVVVYGIEGMCWCWKFSWICLILVIHFGGLRQ